MSFKHNDALDKKCQTGFLVADFDKGNWQECALAYKREAEAARIFRAVTILMNVKFRNGHAHILIYSCIV